MSPRSRRPSVAPSFPVRRLAMLLAVGLVSPLLASDASLDAPATVSVGAEVEVGWSGSPDEGAFVSIDPEGAPESKYGAYQYLRSNPVKLRAPGAPGRYEIRLHSGASGYAVLASSPLEVTAASATVSVPATVSSGGVVSVTWTGPAHSGDFLSLDEAGAKESSYGAYVYTSKGSPVELPVPGEPGSYEVRYHLGASGYPVIGSAPITVEDVGATISVPARVAAGGTITVEWEGPDHPRDFLSFDEAGAPESSYGDYAYTSKGSPLELPVPESPGSYEVRYHLGASGYRVIGSAAVEVGDVTATVRPAETIVAGEPFEVAWTGPGNDLDYVTIVPAGAEEGTYGRYAYTKRGNPVRVQAPDEPGDYEVRYLTGREDRTLASAAVEVLPGQSQGFLQVVPTGGDDAGAPGRGAVEVILDASGSMLQRLEGIRRIELARQALLELVEGAIPAGTPFALRVFGHREADACRTDLEIPLAPLEPAAAAQRIRAVEAMNLAKTPIADSLRRVGEDLAGVEGPRLVVLVTDGEETCSGDPAAAIRALSEGGTRVEVNIVGFAIEELMLREQFEKWAELGGGRYLDATDGDGLRDAMRGAVRPGFQVLVEGEVVASGTVGGAAVEVPVGAVRVRLSDGRDLGEVTVRSDETTRVEAGG